MLAAHLDNLVFLLLLALAGLFQLLGRAARKRSGDKEEPKPAPGTRKPIPRAPAESDEERIRKFLEALGQPAASRPPPPVTPRTDIPPRPVAPVQPPISLPNPPLFLPREEQRKRERIPKEGAPLPTITRARKIVPSKITGEAAFEVHEGQLSVEPPPTIKTPMEAYAAATRPIAKGAELKPDIATLLASKSGLRDAIILREIFGPPRALQALEIGI